MDTTNALHNVSDLLATKERILLLTHIHPDGDAVGSLLGLLLALRKFPGKVVDAVSLDAIPEGYRFLPGVDDVKQEVSSRDLVITVDNSKTPIEKVSYSLQGEILELYITPTAGMISGDSIGHYLGKPKYDLIVTLDCAEPERIGSFVQEEADFFASVPVINIDHHQDNSAFGAVNLIEVSACSTAEIVYRLLEHMGATVDADIATNLLAGMITDTGNFQYSSTTPASFRVAGKLMDLGARHQDIIEHIFRMKRYTTLKIWGNILKKIQTTEDQHIIWSSVTKADVTEAGAMYEEADGVIDELMTTTPHARVVVLFYEYDDHVRVSVRSTNGFDAAQFAEEFGGGGHRKSAGFRLPAATIDEAETKVIAALRTFEREHGKKGAPAEAVYSPDAIIQSISEMMKAKKEVEIT